jgi:hypothetical protein
MQQPTKHSRNDEKNVTNPDSCMQSTPVQHLPCSMLEDPRKIKHCALHHQQSVVNCVHLVHKATMASWAVEHYAPSQYALLFFLHETLFS